MSQLDEWSSEVISVMAEIPEISHLNVAELHNVPLGLLRRNATRLHAICRYNKGVKKTQSLGPTDVRCIDIHPESLTPDWERYAKFLLYHEYLHALGYSNHGKEFRRVEALWPDYSANELGKSFSKMLLEKRAKWFWLCPSCERSHLRSRRGNGRYRCRECRVVLKDIPNFWKEIFSLKIKY